MPHGPARPGNDMANNATDILSDAAPLNLPKPDGLDVRQQAMAGLIKLLFLNHGLTFII